MSSLSLSHLCYIFSVFCLFDLPVFCLLVSMFFLFPWLMGWDMGKKKSSLPYLANNKLMLHFYIHIWASFPEKSDTEQA